MRNVVRRIVSAPAENGNGPSPSGLSMPGKASEYEICRRTGNFEDSSDVTLMIGIPATATPKSRMILESSVAEEPLCRTHGSSSEYLLL